MYERQKSISSSRRNEKKQFFGKFYSNQSVPIKHCDHLVPLDSVRDYTFIYILYVSEISFYFQVFDSENLVCIKILLIFKKIFLS